MGLSPIDIENASTNFSFCDSLIFFFGT